MCGIAGYSGRFDKILLKQCIESLNHRGPDANGIFLDEKHNIGLGHTRLTIIDLSDLANQPLKDNDENCVIVFNGEIYNYLALRKELVSHGYQFKTKSDTEVLLYLYQKYGFELLNKLEGIFAFAIWDKRRKSLFIARDSIGVKPLYYSQTSKGFIFASEIKALISSNAINKSLDKYAIHNYLSFLWSPGERTMLDAVKKLNPGNAMIIRDSKIERHWSWYKLPNPSSSKKDVSTDKIINECKRELRQSVKKQLISDVPVGAFLSGGLDSSSIVAMAKEFNPKISCFTIETEGGAEKGFHDDLPYAKKVANYLNVPLNIVKIRSDVMMKDIEKMVYHLDEPLADPACLNVMYISQLAKENDIKVLLSGTGGDDLLTGYRRHRAIRYDHLLKHLPQKLKIGLNNFSSSLSQKTPLKRRLSKFLNGVQLEGSQRVINYLKWSSDSITENIYSEQFKEDLGAYNSSSEMIDFLSGYSGIQEDLNKSLLLDQRYFLADHNLIYTDKMSMAAGVEVRVPFLERNFVDFSSKIPLNLKQKNGQEKWILKKAMESFLPIDVIYRQKTGFGAPLRKWLRGDMRSFLHDILSEKNIRKRNIFDYNSTMNLIKMNHDGHIDASYVIFSILCIELWCQNFLD